MSFDHSSNRASQIPAPHVNMREEMTTITENGGMLIPLDTKNHPIWDVYDMLRTARLNIKYHRCRLSYWKTVDFWFNFSLALVAPSSAVTSLWLWETPAGAIAWRVLVSITAIIAIAKPLIKTGEKVQSYEKALHGYVILGHNLEKIEMHIKQDKRYSEKHRTLLESAKDMEGKIKETDPEIKTNEKIRKKCQNEVLKELPQDHFYIPEKEIAI
jgi:hypothetical protein